MQRFLGILGVIWAAPYSLFGLVIGLLGLCIGGRGRWHTRAWEFHGGAVTMLVRYVCGSWVSAVTFGHTILGRDDRSLEVSRSHEWVHVRQYERWGPFFVPAYLLWGLYLWTRGRNPYRDNPFEIEACETCRGAESPDSQDPTS